MKRAEAFATVRQRGGTPRRGVTKQTGLLIVGGLGWPLLADGRPSNSLAHAKSYGVPIASEQQFLEWIGKAVPQEQAKTYTAEELASLSKLPKDVVEQIAIFGLIEPRRGHYGFRDLAAARQIAALLASAIKLSVITRSLYEIRKWLPDSHLANLRLFPESSDTLLIEQINGRTDETGQFLLPMASQQDNPEVLFEQAQVAEDANDVATAERLYRRVMKLDPEDAAAPYNLGNLLRGNARAIEAEAAYRVAIDADPQFAEAGTIWPTFSTSKAAPRRRSFASSAPSMPTQTTRTPCSTLRCFFKGSKSTRQRPSGGEDTLSSTAAHCGPRARDAP